MAILVIASGMIYKDRYRFVILTGMAWKAKTTCYKSREIEVPGPEG